MTEQQKIDATARQVRITSRWDSSRVLFTFEAPEGLESGLWMRVALEAAAESGANLRDADLRDANLSDADLSDANLRDANLSGANLSGANLSDANLRDADLSGANLRGANLSGANLRGANLSDANLRDADLSGANLRGANLRAIKTDFFDVLLRAPREIAALKTALMAGKVDGSTYEGSCACLVGTIANSRGANYQELGSGLSPDAGRPIERFFMNIRRGDTPATKQCVQIAIEWIDEFAALMHAAAPTFTEAAK